MSCYTTKNMTISAFKAITVDSHHRIIVLNDLCYGSLKMFMEIRCPSEMTHFFYHVATCESVITPWCEPRIESTPAAEDSRPTFQSELTLPGLCFFSPPSRQAWCTENGNVDMSKIVTNGNEQLYSIVEKLSSFYQIFQP